MTALKQLPTWRACSLLLIDVSASWISLLFFRAFKKLSCWIYHSVTVVQMWLILMEALLHIQILLYVPLAIIFLDESFGHIHYLFICIPLGTSLCMYVLLLIDIQLRKCQYFSWWYWLVLCRHCMYLCVTKFLTKFGFVISRNQTRWHCRSTQRQKQFYFQKVSIKNYITPETILSHSLGVCIKCRKKISTRIMIFCC